MIRANLLTLANIVLAATPALAIAVGVYSNTVPLF
jgi:hypothetical protein